MMMKRSLIILVLLFLTLSAMGQKRVAITIDDVPNTTLYHARDKVSPLLSTINSLHLPVTVFINEGNIYHAGTEAGNLHLLSEWISLPGVTPGNHTFSHLRASQVDASLFTRDVIKGETHTRRLASTHGKTLDLFRFPYNDLGADSLQQATLRSLLAEQGYQVVPFTIESSDWMFSHLYEHYLNMEKPREAERIATAFVDYTLAMFDHFETVSHEMMFSRPVPHIFLCHDNALMAHSLPGIVNHLQRRGYSVISLRQALADPAYRMQEHYHGKWGFSWIYRWIEDPVSRKEIMQAEPSMMDYYREYESLQGRTTP